MCTKNTMRREQMGTTGDFNLEEDEIQKRLRDILAESREEQDLIRASVEHKALKARERVELSISVLVFFGVFFALFNVLLILYLIKTFGG